MFKSPDMSPEDVAREAIERANPGFALGAPDHASRLVVWIARVIRAEREACAKIAENAQIEEPPTIFEDARVGWNNACIEIAADIRKRS